MTHELKIHPEYFHCVRDRTKMFEYRKADRDFNVGDKLVLREWCPKKQEYTGHSIWRSVTYCLWLRDGYWSMKASSATHVILSIT